MIYLTNKFSMLYLNLMHQYKTVNRFKVELKASKNTKLWLMSIFRQDFPTFCSIFFFLENFVHSTGPTWCRLISSNRFIAWYIRYLDFKLSDNEYTLNEYYLPGIIVKHLQGLLAIGLNLTYNKMQTKVMIIISDAYHIYPAYLLLRTISSLCRVVQFRYI